MLNSVCVGQLLLHLSTQVETDCTVRALEQQQQRHDEGTICVFGSPPASGGNVNAHLLVSSYSLPSYMYQASARFSCFFRDIVTRVRTLQPSLFTPYRQPQ